MRNRIEIKSIMPYSYDKKKVLKIKYFTKALIIKHKEANLSVIFKDKRVSFKKRSQPKAAFAQ